MAYTGTTFKLTYTKLEWNNLDKLAVEAGFPNFRTYVKRQLKELSEKTTPRNIAPCPCENSGPGDNKDAKIFEVPYNRQVQLDILSERYCMDIGNLARRFIADPLLNLYFEKHGY